MTDPKAIHSEAEAGSCCGLGRLRAAAIHQHESRLLMCQCGCSEGLEGKRFPGPGGITYVLEIYPGCKDCGTPAGVAVKSFATAGDETFWFEHMPFAVFRDYQGKDTGGAPGSEFVQAIVDPEDVLLKLKEVGAGASVLFDGQTWPFADFLDDADAEDAIRDGICKTLIDFDKAAPSPPSATEAPEGSSDG